MLKRRLAARDHAVGEISDARLEDFFMLDRAYEPPVELDHEHLIAIRSARSADAVVVATLKTLAGCRAKSAATR
jgi:hypothetical protein